MVATMKRIASYVLFALTAIVFVGTPSTAFAQALPPCPEDQNLRYHNCFGTYTYGDGSKYVGEWRDDKQHGQGTYTYADGSKYVGEYRDGLRNGQGTYTWADGRKYVGEFRDDKRTGVGTMVSPDGTVLHGGLWLNGEPVVKR